MKMRRYELEIKNQDEVLSLLKKAPSITLSMVDTSISPPKPYAVPLNFSTICENGTIKIYVHCAKQGRKLSILEKNQNVCFSCVTTQKVIDSGFPSIPCRWSTKYESVYGEGIARILYGSKICGESPLEKETRKKAMDALMEKHGFEGKPQYIEKMLDAIPLIEIDVHTLSGKRKK